jgi:hypothetical protein
MSTEADAAQPQPPAHEQVSMQPPVFQPQTRSRTNVLAIIALVGSFFIGLVGVICGVISLTQIKRTREKGRGLAIAGIAVGGAQIIASIAVTVVIVTAAAALSTTAALAGSLETFPQLTPAAGESQECADLLALLTESRSSIQEDLSTEVATDPQAAVDSIAALSGKLHDAADSSTNPKFAEAVLNAASELDDAVDELRVMADDPASASPSARAEVVGHFTAFGNAFEALDEVCAPGK